MLALFAETKTRGRTGQTKGDRRSTGSVSSA